METAFFSGLTTHWYLDVLIFSKLLAATNGNKDSFNGTWLNQPGNGLWSRFPLISSRENHNNRAQSSNPTEIETFVDDLESLLFLAVPNLT